MNPVENTLWQNGTFFQSFPLYLLCRFEKNQQVIFGKEDQFFITFIGVF